MNLSQTQFRIDVGALAVPTLPLAGAGRATLGKSTLFEFPDAKFVHTLKLSGGSNIGPVNVVIAADTLIAALDLGAGDITGERTEGRDFEGVPIDMETIYSVCVNFPEPDEDTLVYQDISARVSFIDSNSVTRFTLRNMAAEYTANGQGWPVGIPAANSQILVEFLAAGDATIEITVIGK